jgi:hypothetical protein
MLAVPLAFAPTFIQIGTVEHVAGNFCDLMSVNSSRSRHR